MLYLLYNPKANNGNSEKELKDFPIDFFAGIKSEEVEKINVLSLVDYEGFLKGINSEDIIVIAGGDGTLNNFINAAKDITLTCDVYLYKLGTGNDFMYDIGEHNNNNPIKINKYIRNLPKVYINDKEYTFINGIGFGLDGYCTEEGDRQRAKSVKKVNYTAIAIKGILFKYKRRNASVTVDGVTKEFKRVYIASAMMGRFYGGGMMVTPMQDRLNEEHTLTFSVIYRGSKLHILSVFPKIFKGKHVTHTEIFYAQPAHEITVEFDVPCSLQIDGETVLNVKKYTARYE